MDENDEIVCLKIRSDIAERFYQYCVNNSLRNHSEAIEFLLNSAEDVCKFISSQIKSAPVAAALTRLTKNQVFVDHQFEGQDLSVVKNNVFDEELPSSSIDTYEKDQSFSYLVVRKKNGIPLQWVAKRIIFSDGQEGLLVVQPDLNFGIETGFAIFEIRNNINGCLFNLHSDMLINELTVAVDFHLKYKVDWKLSQSLEHQFTILKSIFKPKGVLMDWSIKFIYDDFEQRILLVENVKVNGVAYFHQISSGSIIKTITDSSGRKMDFSLEILALCNILKSLPQFTVEFIKLVPPKLCVQKNVQEEQQKICQNNNALTAEPHLSRRNRAKLKKLILKKPLNDICSKCRFQCHKKFNYQQREEICINFHRLPDKPCKREFIRQTVSVSIPSTRWTNLRVRSHVFRYFLHYANQQHRVCKRFFLATLNVSDKVVRYAVTKNYHNTVGDNVFNEIADNQFPREYAVNDVGTISTDQSSPVEASQVFGKLYNNLLDDVKMEIKSEETSSSTQHSQ